MTWRYLDRYLPPEGSILEIGAATGAYTLKLAGRGYALTVVDLSQKLVEICRRRIAVAGLAEGVRFVLADARDLSQIEETGFDAVLLMGPLYHLVVEEDRVTALKEAYRHLRDGGLIFSSFISRFGILGDLIKKKPEWIERGSEVRSVIERGSDPEELPRARGGFRGYFAEVSEIAPLHEHIGFETTLVAGLEPAISADDQSYNRLRGAQRQLWLDLLYELSREETIIGASRHLLYVGKKPKK
jgi:SAM-dependent methyltransferase